MSELSRLLRPKSIALFGGGWAENVIVQLVKSGFSGHIWPVHPKRDEICGIDCFKNISQLPSPPDASFVGVNRHLTIEVVSGLSEMGAGGAICFASGFLESDAEGTGGAELQKRLVEAAGSMPILGPNCYGLLNYLDNATLWPDQHGGRSVERGVALLGQSSNVLINMTMQKRSLPIAYTIAAGNQAQTSLSSMASALIEDDRVTAIGLYVEGFGDIRQFEAMAAKARDLGKPIVAIKTGKSEKARMASMTHTASLAGGAAASSAFLERLGIVEVNSIAVFLETLKLLHAFGPLKGNAISSMSCSGGEASLISDMAAESRIDFRDFSKQQYAVLKQVLGPIVTVANPLDYHTFIWGDENKLTDCYTAVLADNFDLNILIMDIPAQDRCDMSAWLGPLRAIKTAAQKTGSKVVLLATLPENLHESLGDELLLAGVVPMLGMEEMILAIDAAIFAGKIYGQNPKPVALGRSGFEYDIVLNEHDSKAQLAGYGLPVPTSILAPSPETAEQAASKLGFPVALKGLGVVHKSEAGAVVLNLNTPEEVRCAAENMRGVSGFLVEKMAQGIVAEVLVGVTRDATGMFLLTIGGGGVLTELLNDTASLVLPCDRSEIQQAIEHLKIFRILKGYRGKPAADMEAMLDAIEAIQRYCLDHPELIELDVNPLLALEQGALAVDAVIRIEEE